MKFWNLDIPVITRSRTRTPQEVSEGSRFTQMPFSSGHNQKTLTGSFVSGIFLLFTSLFGPFLLRNFQRRRMESQHQSTQPDNPPLIVISKPIENPVVQNVHSERQTDKLEMERSPGLTPEQELQAYQEFISQLPPPTLAYIPQTPSMVEQAHTESATKATTTTTDTKTQSFYEDVSPTGAVRTVLQEQTDFGNGRRWRRKLVVFHGGGVESMGKPHSGRRQSVWSGQQD